MSLTSLVLACVLAADDSPVSGGRPLELDTSLRIVDDVVSVETSRVSFGALQDGDPQSTPETDEQAFQTPAPPPPYGSADTARWRFHFGKAVEVNNSSNTLLMGGLAYTKFFAKGLSLDLELNGIIVDQRGDDSGGANLNLLVRWHFIMERNWTVYLDGGAGILLMSDDVPENGSDFNFTPQAGVGFTRDIGKDVRLIAGIRWQHISNANLYSSNPGRDSVLGYIGLSFPY